MADQPSITAEEDVPVFTRCHRWRTHLTRHSTVFHALEAERELGWRSPALDAWYAGHQRPRGMESDEKPSSSSTSTKTTVTTESAPTTSFAAANIAQLADRYRDHCKRILTSAAPELFASSNSTTSTSPWQFLDMGCAPGGVSKFLVQDLRWSGIGVTLSAADGGIAVDEALLTHSRKSNRGRSGGDSQARFALWEGDVIKPPSSWHPASFCSCTQDEANVSHYTLDDGGEAGQWDSEWRFRLVNGGAVQDHGQRLRADQAQHPSTAEKNEDGDDDNSTKANEGTRDGKAILPWLTLFVPQLRVALGAVAHGGAAMLVYGAPQCASLMILLKALEPLFHLGTPQQDLTSATPEEKMTIDKNRRNDSSSDENGERASSAPAERVAVLETMHLVKPPVYVLFKSLYTRSHEPKDTINDSSKRGERDGEREVRVARLLRALDPTSDTLSPLLPSPTTRTQAGELARLSREERRTAKELFWLGESDEGFALAREGFATYGPLVEAVWKKARLCLQGRRLRAERAMAPGKAGGGRPLAKRHRY